MKKIYFVLLAAIISTNLLLAQSNLNQMQSTKKTYLALGDSYTIGEGVVSEKNFPQQLKDKLSEEGLNFELTKIIAKTGWTTDELKNGINDAEIKGQTFDLVTLLIGVNNQYRGRPVENYRKEFEELLQDAIAFAGGKSKKVIVLSIPDWGITPFAQNKGVNQEKVAKEIDAYNAAKLETCGKLQVKYVNITDAYRAYGADREMLAEDDLHPSEMVYRDWAQKLVEEIKKINW
jgi:lysophospholipase L1-like esterase